PRALAILPSWPPPHTSSRAPRRQSARLALVPPPPRWSRRARPATATDAVNCSVRWQRICVPQYLQSSSTRRVRRVSEFSIPVRLHHCLKEPSRRVPADGL